jgi:zinc and cadmium transporter
VHDTHAQPHDHGRSGALIVVGDTVHNFVDGVLIALGIAAIASVRVLVGSGT